MDSTSALELLDTITVRHDGGERRIQLMRGDLTAIPAEEAVDVLVVSAFKDDYVPVRGTLIGALDRAGVSVAQLATSKEADLRQFSSCWLSKPVGRPDLGFERILCFEPRYRGSAPEVVGDVFRSLVPFVAGDPPMRQVATPLLASGNQAAPGVLMLRSLVEAAVHWMSSGLPLDCLKIVIRPGTVPDELTRLREAFAAARAVCEKSQEPATSDFAYDLFVSYAHIDGVLAAELVEALKVRDPRLRIFVDRLELNSGASWQQHIFEALDASRFILCLYSPAYLASKVCQEEFNVGLMRQRESGDVMLPVYLFSASLPTYMRLIQYDDIREGDLIKIQELSDRVLDRIRPEQRA